MRLKAAVVVTLLMFVVSIPAASAGPAPLAEAAKREGARLARTAAPLARQPATPKAKSNNPIYYGALAGGVAGALGGLLAPTHSNGEYLVSGHAVTTVVVGAVGAASGALIGWAVKKARD